MTTISFARHQFPPDIIVRALFAKELRRRRHRPTAQWYLDEMAVLIGGKRFWLWRGVDDEGEVLDLLVQRRRDARAATKALSRPRFLLVNRTGRPSAHMKQNQ